MSGPFVPEAFSDPPISPNVATLFRRTPYISLEEYEQAPTAISAKDLVPGGDEAEQQAALAGVIMRASGWVDDICFHRAAGSLAASPTTESDWIKPRGNGELRIICNFKPILEVRGMAIGMGPNEVENIGNAAARAIGMTDPVITVPRASGLGLTPFGCGQGPNGCVWVVWTYVNGFPHTYLATDASQGATSIAVGPSEPGGTEVFGIYPGTQLTIHDGANTEVIVVEAVEGLTLQLRSPLMYEHTVPTAPGSIRVSAIPWVVEQATISLTTALVKTRGNRAMVLPQSPGAPTKQVEGQAGSTKDTQLALNMLKPYVVPYVR